MNSKIKRNKHIYKFSVNKGEKIPVADPIKKFNGPNIQCTTKHTFHKLLFREIYLN